PEVPDREGGEHDEGDHLLDHLELRGGELPVAPAVRRHLEAVLEEGDAVGDQHHLPERLVAKFEMPVPGDGHEHVRGDEKQDGRHRAARLAQKSSTRRARSPAAPPAAASVPAWLGPAGPSPSARLVITETAATRSPQWRARIVSGTVDIPTASAPKPRIMRISAGVSNEGPG